MGAVLLPGAPVGPLGPVGPAEPAGPVVPVAPVHTYWVLPISLSSSTPLHLVRLALAGKLALLAACGGSDGAHAPAPATALIAVAVEPAGKHCESGGSRVDAGLDIDRDGVLAASEVASTQYVCDGAPGPLGQRGLNALAVMVDAQGAPCEAGGKAVQVGEDENRNGLLDADEISSTAYLCNGADSPNALAISARIEPGTSIDCPYGGIKLTTGLDLDGDGSLSEQGNEIKSTSFACDGVPGEAMPWIDVIGTSAAARPNFGYIAHSDTEQVVITLPGEAELKIGDVVRIGGAGDGGWKLAQNDDANGGQAIFTKSLGGMAGATWTTNPTSVRGWFAMASSANGSRLVAIGQSQNSGIAALRQLYTSADGGKQWKAGPEGYWNAIASSANGRTLIASRINEYLYISTDGGDTWTASATDTHREWQSVASSEDGRKLVAAAWQDGIYTSTDSGQSWSSHAAGMNKAWHAVASSADGNRLVAVAQNDQIYVSTNGGASWTPRASVDRWSSVASSSDGSRLFAAAFQGQLYTSADGGATWVPRASSQLWRHVVSSADGRKLVAVGEDTNVFTSCDGGETWVARLSARDRQAVAMSHAGDRIAVGNRNNEVGPVFEPTAPVFTSFATTTPGIAGSISGGPTDAIELQYLGNSRFHVLSHEGELVIE